MCGGVLMSGAWSLVAKQVHGAYISFLPMIQASAMPNASVSKYWQPKYNLLPSAARAWLPPQTQRGGMQSCGATVLLGG